MDWMQLINQVSNMIYDNPSTPHQPGVDPGNLVGNITQMLMQQQQTQGRPDANTLEQIKQEIYNNPSTPHQPGFDPNGLIQSLEGLFLGQQKVMSGDQQVMPASRDPLGDAGKEGYQTQVSPDMGDVPVQPASEDPYGDAANQ
jgi:hypothetical protein